MANNSVLFIDLFRGSHIKYIVGPTILMILVIYFIPSGQIPINFVIYHNNFETLTQSNCK